MSKVEQQVTGPGRRRFLQTLSAAGLTGAVGPAAVAATGAADPWKQADAIIRRYGRDVFRRIWEGPALLPTLDELRHPDDWARRVTGRVGEPTA